MRFKLVWIPAFFLGILPACSADTAKSLEAEILAVDTLSSNAGIELFEPIAIAQSSADAIYILDKGNSELYRLTRSGQVDTLATSGSGPGELKGPTAFALLGYTAVVIDVGNGRIQFIDAQQGGTIRTLSYARGAAHAVIDPAERWLYTVTFGQNFALLDGRPVLRGSTLITVLSLEDGQIVHEFGAPRPYQGTVLPILGNHVHITRSPSNGELWVSWPYEPDLERFTTDGIRVGTLLRPMAFAPQPPEEYTRSGSPLPAVDAQLITYAVQIDSAGRLFVLTAIAPKLARLGSEDYEVPPQAVDILSSAGDLQCRISLPFRAWSFVLAGEDELLFTDIIESSEVYRLRYRCG